MKKFYESPIVELTVFDVEDVITTSAVNTGTMDVSSIDTLVDQINQSEYAMNNNIRVGNYNTYTW